MYTDLQAKFNAKIKEWILWSLDNPVIVYRGLMVFLATFILASNIYFGVKATPALEKQAEWIVEDQAKLSQLFDKCYRLHERIRRLEK